MLVKVWDVDPDFVERLKQLTSEKTGSKAFARAAVQFESLHAHNLLLTDRVDSLRAELQRAYQIIEGARSAAALLLDRTAQTDIDL